MLDSKHDICCIHCGIKVDGDDLQLVGQHRKDALTALEARAATLDLHALLANIDKRKKNYLYA